MENVKEKILLFVQSIGLSKAEIARQLGISKSNFVGEAMTSDLNVSMVIKFCQLYPQVSAEWLLRGTGDMLITNKPMEINIDNSSRGGHHNTNIGSIGTQTIANSDLAELKQQIAELKADKEKLYQLLLKQ